MTVFRPILPILPLKLVAIATPLSNRKKRVRFIIYDQISTIFINSVKIGTVYLEIGLKGINKKKLTQAELAYSQVGKHAERAKLDSKSTYSLMLTVTFISKLSAVARCFLID